MSSLRKLARFVASVPSSANVIFWVTLHTWILKAAFVDPVTETMHAITALGRVLDGLFGSIIAGYIFYILFALWPDFEARLKLSAFISRKVASIAGDCQAVIDEVGRASRQALSFQTATRVEVERFFSATQTSTHPNMVVQNGAEFLQATWFQYFESRTRRTSDSIQDLFKQSRFLDVNIISLLVEVEESSYLLQIEAIAGRPIRNTNLGFISSSFYDYMMLCRRVALWHDAQRPVGREPFFPRPLVSNLNSG